MAVVATRTHELALAQRASWAAAVRAALPAWVISRVVVGLTLVLARGHDATGSLLAWDVAWYHNLGVHGYGSAVTTRFFPLLPGIIWLGHSIGMPALAWQTAVCWVAALFFAAALHKLTVLETGSASAGRRAAWLIQLVPGANVLALGYTEALAGLLAVLYFLAVRSRSTRPGLVVGVLAGLARPTAPVLVIPGLVEAARRRRGWLLALAPLVGTALYLGWAWAAWGSPLTPYRVQAAGDLRGGVVRAPWEYLVHTSAGGYPWPLVLGLLLVAAVALVLCARLLPVSYVLWALPMVGLGVTAWGMHSVPRYVAAVFPLWMAVAIVCRRPRAWWPVLAISGAGFAWVAYLAFVPGGPVP